MRERMGILFIFIGIMVFLVSILGIYRLKYVMNRMHAAAMADTLGFALVAFGTMFFCENVFQIGKYMLVILFFWLSSPIASYMIGKVEMLTNKDYNERVHDK